MKTKILLPFIFIVLLITPERNLLGASSKENKAYVNNNCGKNKVVLNKEIPIADQLNKRNTIYVVKNSFDLNDANGVKPVRLPSGCTLEFDGGSLKGGGVMILDDNCKILNGVFVDVLVSLGNNSAIVDTYFKGGDLNSSGGLSTKRAMLSAKAKSNIRVQSCVFFDGVLGCLFDHCKKVEFKGNKLKNWTLWGVYCIHSEDLLFTKNNCDNCNDGLKFGFYIKDAVISENICVNNIRDGIDYAGFGAKNVEISKNKLVNNTIFGIEFKTLNRRSEGHDYNPIHHGYKLNELDWNNIKIIDNEIKNNNILKSSTGIGHVMFYGDEIDVRNINITGNTIEANNGLYIVGLNKKDFVIKDNTINSVEYGITIASATNVVVRNSKIYNTGTKGEGVRIVIQETTGSAKTHTIRNVSMSNLYIESNTCVSIGETVDETVSIKNCTLLGKTKVNNKSLKSKLNYVSDSKESF